VDELKTPGSDLVDELNHFLLESVVFVLELVDEHDQAVDALVGQGILDLVQLHVQETFQ